LRFKSGFNDIFFLTTQGKIPEFARVISELAKQQGFPASDIGVYIQPVAQGTSCHCEFTLYYNPVSQAELNLARKLEVEAVDSLEARGAFFSRPYRGWAEVAYRRARDTAEMQRKVKDIFDPNWILNPGKLCF
jgi:FAD/FMN-containing dehydrogenase